MIILTDLAYFIILIVTIVFVHELGHYLCAISLRVHVQNFAIGFGKEIIGFNDKRGCRWQLRLLPLGGFIKMAGDNSVRDAIAEYVPEIVNQGDGVAGRRDEFDSISAWRKLMIIMGGPLANICFSLLIIFVLSYTSNIQYVPPVIGSVSADSPADRAGLEVGDRIEKIDDEQVNSFDDVAEIISKSAHKSVTIYVDRSGSVLSFKLNPEIKRLDSKEERPVIGIGGDISLMVQKPISMISAIELAYSTVWHACKLTASSIYQVVAGTGSELKSVIYVANVSTDMIEIGNRAFIWFAAMLSINLGIINLVPLLPLDGGRCVVVLVDSIFSGSRKRWGNKIKFYYAASGVSLVLLAITVALFNDLKQLISTIMTAIA